MADKTITQLTAATTPLAGTEVLPIVQSSTTRKVSVADLTAGRSISASGASISGNVSVGTATAIARLTVDAASGSPSTTNKGALLVGTDTNVGVVIGAFDGTGSNYNGYIQTMDKRSGFDTAYGLTLQPLGGNVTLTNGNLVIGTAGKGIDFSINPSAPGMTSELLSSYEEGTFTPVVTGTAVFGVGTYTAQVGTYVKIGSLVQFQIVLGWSAHTGAGNFAAISGLPYAAANNANWYFTPTFFTSDLATTAGTTIEGFIAPGSATLALREVPTGGGAASVIAFDTQVTFLMISGSYRTA